MGGLTLGIVLTAAFFIFFHPFQKKPVVNETSIAPQPNDSLHLPGNSDRINAITGSNPAFLQNKDRIDRDSLILFAKSLLGTPYLYGSMDPAKGFDCSGFITYVFNHFKFAVPRSSYDFANIGIKGSLPSCRKGDVILFTGTDGMERAVGHIGIVCDIINGMPSFIHSTSGKAYGVTITSMENKYYQDRFISVNDLLFQN